MNGKQAKRLRRAAMGLAVHLTEEGKDIKKDGYVVRKHHNPSLSSIGAGDRDPFNAPSYQLTVRKDSLKGIYKSLKGGKV
jgi:hypothetical protein